MDDKTNRPTQLFTDTAAIRQKAAEGREIPSTFRTMVKEWVLELTFDDETSAIAYRDEKFSGRLESEDMRIEDETELRGRWTLYTHRWNVRSEWKDIEVAEAEATAELLTLRENDPQSEATVAARNSADEHKLAGYGTALLASAREAQKAERKARRAAKTEET